MPPEPFSVSVVVGLEDRISAALFSYRDLFAAARRRLLHGLAWAMLVLLLMAGFSAWKASEGAGAGAFAARLASDLSGIGLLPFLVIALPALLYYAWQPRLVRGRLRRWYRDEGLDAPIEIHYRFEPGGLVSTVTGQSSRLGCSRIAGLSEDSKHLLIRIQDDEEILVLPRDGLAEADLEKVRGWASACHAGGSGTDRPFIDAQARLDEEPLLTTRFTLTEADRVVALRWQMERPGWRRQRRRGALISFLVVTLLPPAAMMLFWSLDRDRVPFAYAFPLLIEMLGSTLLPWILGGWALVAAVLAVHPWLRRQHARQLARKLQRRVQPYEYEARLFEDRLESEQPGLLNRFEWPAFLGFEKHGEHILLLRRSGEPLILPLRALCAEELAVFERIMHNRLGLGGSRAETGP